MKTDKRRGKPAPGDDGLRAAALLLLGDARRGPDPGAAYNLYVAQARAGSARAAQHAAVLSAQGVGCVGDWSAALDWLLAAAVLGDRGARRQLAALSGRTEPRVVSGEASSEGIWRTVRKEIDLESLLTPPQARIVSESPAIRIIRGFASPAMAAWLIRTAQNRLERGLVHNVETGEASYHQMRTAHSASLNILAKDIVTLVMQERAARATGAPLAHHEPPNVISYEPGQQFEPHFDFVDPAVPDFQLELMLQGQRVATCVTYLNDDFEGAETEFPRLNWRFKGGVGDALIFANVTPEGQVDPKTLHAGLPPTRGRKWILSQWLRNRSQPVL